MKKREEKWKANGNTRFVKGNYRELYRLRKFGRSAKMIFEVAIVQPGLSKAQASRDILQLLGCTELYLNKTASAEFKVYCSA
jgi:hypothetical protein